jgi:hypothetical protein
LGRCGLTAILFFSKRDHRQAGNAAKLACIICDERRTMDKGRGGNPKVIRAYHCSRFRQMTV